MDRERDLTEDDLKYGRIARASLPEAIRTYRAQILNLQEQVRFLERL